MAIVTRKLTCDTCAKSVNFTYEQSDFRNLSTLEFITKYNSPAEILTLKSCKECLEKWQKEF